MEKMSLKPALFLSAAICFMFFVFAPMEMYFTNKDELWYDLYILMPVVMVMFLIFMAIFMAGFWVLYKWNMGFYKTALVALLVAFVCSYIQGNYFVEYLPVINGGTIDWNELSNQGGGRVETVVLWIVVMAVVILLVYKLHMGKMCRLIQIASICMILMFTVTLVTVCLTNQGLENKSNVDIAVTDHILEMSIDQNFIILLLDALDGGAFTDMVVGNEDYESIFEDFTYYENTTSAYPHTEFNIPFILSGMWYENRTSEDDYFKQVQMESPVYEELEKHGYAIGVYDEYFPIAGGVKGRFENVGSFTQKVSSNLIFARWQIKMTGMKYLPFDLKRFCVVDPTTLEWLRRIESSSEAFHGDNLNFYEHLLEEGITCREDKSFKLIHLWGAHSPHVLDKDLNYLEEGGTFTQSVEASISLTDIYLNKLKESGVYDNSIIIIMADHGNYEYNMAENYQQHPILLIKGFDERHAFQVDDSPISFEDLTDAYTRLLDEMPGGGYTVFDNLPQTRGRRFLFYDIKEPRHMVEYMQTGDAGDVSTLLPTGEEFNRKGYVVD